MLTPSSAPGVRSTFHASQYTDSLELLEEEAADLDAVVIGTPHTHHHEQIVAALEHDRHVYYDKPLATDQTMHATSSRSTPTSTSSSLTSIRARIRLAPTRSSIAFSRGRSRRRLHETRRVTAYRRPPTRRLEPASGFGLTDSS